MFMKCMRFALLTLLLSMVGCGHRSSDSDGFCEECGGSGVVTQLCVNCAGRGEVDCRPCKGIGKTVCGICYGDGDMECSACFGKGSLASVGGDASIREYCFTCHGTGRKQCYACAGSGSDFCMECRGAGKVECRSCGGKGGVRVLCPECRYE